MTTCFTRIDGKRPRTQALMLREPGWFVDPPTAEQTVRFGSSTIYRVFFPSIESYGLQASISNTNQLIRHARLQQYNTPSRCCVVLQVWLNTVTQESWIGRAEAGEYSITAAGKVKVDISLLNDAGGASYTSANSVKLGYNVIAVAHDLETTKGVTMCINGVMEQVANTGSNGSHRFAQELPYFLSRGFDSGRGLRGALLGAYELFRKPDDAEVRQLCNDPYLVFRKQRRIIPKPALGSYTHPTLSNPRMDPLTASGGIPKVDWAFS